MQIELVKVGKWGNKNNYSVITDKDLSEVVETFQGEAPITIGHTYADIMPAFGWVKKVEKKDGVLVGEIELSDLLKEAFEQGLYKKWSVGIKINPEGKKYLHHVAFLGAIPPKIKDLKVFDGKLLSDVSSDEVWVELADTKLVSRAKTDWLIADSDTPWDADGAKKRLYDKGILDQCCAVIELMEGEDKPEALSRYHFPYCDIVDGRVKIIPKAVSTGIAYLNGARGVRVNPDLAKKARPVLEKLQKRIQEKKEKEEKNMSDLEGLKKRLEEYERQFKEMKLAELKQAVKGKLPETKNNLLTALADSLSVEQTIELSDAEGKTKTKMSTLDLLIEIFKSIPQPVDTKSIVSNLSDMDKDIVIDKTALLTRV